MPAQELRSFLFKQIMGFFGRNVSIFNYTKANIKKDNIHD